MNFNKPDTKLDECIFIAKQIIPADLCDAIVQDIETREWEPHMWYNNVTDTNRSEETKELDVQSATPELHRVLADFVVEAGKAYYKNYSYILSVKIGTLKKFYFCYDLNLIKVL